MTKIDGFNVTLVDTNGDECVFDAGSLDDAHLWTIQDAKNGDILVYNDSIFIFNDIYKNNLIYYCIYEYDTFHNDEYYSFLDLNTIYINNIHPATKEQRDTLMKAMIEEGYEWDGEKRELRKIEQKPEDMS